MHSSTRANVHVATVLLSGDLIVFGVVPYLNQNDYIRLAGVCSEWRRAILWAASSTLLPTTTTPIHDKVYSNRLRREKFLQKIKGRHHDMFQLFSKFEFRDCQLMNAHFKTMFHSQTISSIQLNNTNFVSSSILPSHVDLKTLKDLHLVNITLSTSDVQNIARGLRHFNKLTLTNNGMDHRGVSLLLQGNYCNLVSFKIFNPIGCEGVTELLNSEVISQLKELFIGNLKSDEQKGVSNIVHNSVHSRDLAKLESLELLFTRLDPTSFNSILKRATNLKYLGCKSPLSPEYSSKTIDYTLISQMHSIESISFFGSASRTISHQIISHLNHHPNLNRIDFLSLTHSQPLQELCKGNNDLKFFRAYLDITRAEDLKTLFTRFQNITTLILGRCNLNNECLKSISLLCNVIDLDVSENVFDSEGVKYLCQMKSLERINMDSCQNLCDRTLQYISKGNLIRLNYLSLYHTPITDRGLIFLSESRSLPSLSLLDIGLTQIGDEGLVALSKGVLKDQIKDLYLHYTKTGFQGLSRVLTDLKNLKCLCFMETNCRWMCLMTIKLLASFKKVTISKNFLDCDFILNKVVM
ncbi:hypothetical protein C9374_010783 [Naegleria lovaniensis]|uniref:F-box domain-containing protein n=1 Tax=Naegleria lovaniensis TaxID=51637 RepID=A0AA88GFR7_NAELO|nr:uncharacterized protein C9374_010783 [Naegleria lovaniensis]KAG2374499.1 hypothetical protein C9374_010783 [Naegleria lovaniensis]